MYLHVKTKGDMNKIKISEEENPSIQQGVVLDDMRSVGTGVLQPFLI